MDRRSTRQLTIPERRLLARIRSQCYSAAELAWLDQHLAPDVPVLLVGEIRYRWRLAMEPSSVRKEES